MDLERAKLQLKDLKDNQLCFVNDEDKNNKENEFIKDAEAIDIVLTALDNSVSKDEIRKIINNNKPHTAQQKLQELLNKGG